MRYPFLRRFVLSLLLLTFVGGPWLSAAADAAPKPCAMAMSADTASNDAGMMTMPGAGKSMPCQDSTPACMKRICCLMGATLLIPQPSALSVLATSTVRYLPTALPGGGRSVEPELFPPITA
jgi:hypothetical protein